MIFPRGALPFTGRQRELEALESALDRCTVQGLRWVWVWGRGGVGKTRLVWEFLRGLPPPIRWAWAQAPSDPKLLWRRWLLRLSPDPLLEVPESELYFHLLNLIRNRASQVPLVLVCEDLQAGASEILVALRRLTKALAPFPVLLLTTHHIPPPTPMDEELVLSPLGMENLACLLEAIPLRHDPGFLLWLFRKTGGVPLFVEEVLRALDRAGMIETRPVPHVLPFYPHLSLPASLEGLLQERIEGLGPLKRKLLPLALYGSRIPRRIVTALVEEETLAQAMEQGLLQWEEGELCFTHDLLRERMLQAEEGLLEVHRVLGEKLLELGELDEGVAHLVRSGARFSDRDLPLLERVLEEALNRANHILALHLFRGVRRDLSPAGQLRLLLVLARCEALPLPEFRKELEELLTQVPDDAVPQESLARAQAYIAYREGNWPEVVRQGRKVLVATPQDPLRWTVAAALYYQGHLKEARREAQVLIRQPSGRPADRAWGHYLLTYLTHAEGDIEKAVVHARQAIQASREAGAPGRLAQSLIIYGHLLTLQGLFPEAQVAFRQAQEVITDHGLLTEELGLAYYWADMALYAEDLERAEEALSRCMELAETFQDPMEVGFALLKKAEVMLAFGRVKEGEAALQEAQKHLEGDRFALWAPWIHRLAAWVALACGAPRDALSLLRKAAEVHRKPAPVERRVKVRTLRGAAWLRLGRRKEGLETLMGTLHFAREKSHYALEPWILKRGLEALEGKRKGPDLEKLRTLREEALSRLGLQTSSPLPPVELRFMGGFEARLRGREITVPSLKARQLLALLAVRRREGISRILLREELWPYASEEKQRRNLKWLLSTLRHLLGGEVFLSQGERLFLNPEWVWVDLWVLEEGLKEAERLRREGHWLQAHRVLEETLRGVGGEPFPDLLFPPLELFYQELKSRTAAACEALARFYREALGPEAARPWLEKARRIAPEREGVFSE